MSLQQTRVNLSSQVNTLIQGQFKCCECGKKIMTRDLLKKQEETVHRHVANFNVSHSKTSEVEPKLKTHLHNQVVMH